MGNRTSLGGKKRRGRLRWWLRISTGSRKKRRGASVFAYCYTDRTSNSRQQEEKEGTDGAKGGRAETAGLRAAREKTPGVGEIEKKRGLIEKTVSGRTA